MNLDAAIAAHAQWKTKFRMAITKQETMDAVAIGKDNCCDLGKWLHGEGKLQLGSKPEFLSLLEKHKAFHVEAGKVANAINTKKYTEAERMIDSGSSFSAASSAVGVAVNSVKKVAG